jgi:cellulose synthase/poly-beta-1,6-N-acetylglucosamine synthase-like glycosyltransferase
MNDTAVIAIGRNEGQRLRLCLMSALAGGGTVVYVDSNSTDGSVELARSMGADVVELDMSLPFSAARARNAGFERLGPDTRFVQFVDGDCEIVPGWLETARNQLEARSDLAAVCGRRRERFPRASVYNRMADLEWDTPVGEAQSCGGDAMMRADAFREAGGFDASVVAGEEPELCQRLRAKGWKILRVDAEMTLHDAAILHFGQWWRRMLRGGYGAMDVATRFGSQGLFVHHVRSTRAWAIGWPLTLILASPTAAVVLGARSGLITAALVTLTLPLQMLRIALRTKNRVGSFRDAIACGFLTMLSKWADALGQLSYLRDRRAGRVARMIEYKGNGGPVARAAGL